MPRLYYDCHIQAEYMAKEFGVMTYFYVPPHLLDIRRFSDATGRDFALESKNIDRFYIFPESEHIFEPRHNDCGVGCYSKYNNTDTDICYFNSITGWHFIDDQTGKAFDVKIIMRDKKHFFQPKTEKNNV